MADITTKFIPNCKFPSETPKIITGNTLYTILFITFAWVTHTESPSTSFLFESQILAIATTVGTFIQFLIQFIQIYKIYE